MHFLTDPDLRCHRGTTFTEIFNGVQSTCLIPFEEIELLLPIGIEKHLVSLDWINNSRTSPDKITLLDPRSYESIYTLYPEDDVYVSKNPDEVRFKFFYRIPTEMIDLRRMESLPFNIYVGNSKKLKFIPRGSRTKFSTQDANQWLFYHILKNFCNSSELHFVDDDGRVPRLEDFFNPIHESGLATSIGGLEPSLEKKALRETLEEERTMGLHKLVEMKRPLWKAIDGWLTAPHHEHCLVRTELDKNFFKINIGSDARIAAYYAMKEGIKWSNTFAL